MNTGLQADIITNYVQSAYIEIIRSIIPDLEDTYYSLPLDVVRVDSVDMLTIRTELENKLGRDIPDTDWLRFGSLDEIIRYCVQASSPGIARPAEQASRLGEVQKRIVVNMPQMAIEALSESWLFKELGQRHWDMLCAGLATSSADIRDEEGNRLYATFTRVSLKATGSLASFRENDHIDVAENISRYGGGMYLSEIQFRSNASAVTANLLTSFSLRNKGDNKSLVKSQPFTKENTIPAVTEIPGFANKYREIRKRTTDFNIAGGESFPLTGEIIFQTEYEINPYHDLNGVGLLYFAAYPVICDTCEARYFNEVYPAGSRWELEWSTQCRDVCYYGNCNANDTIIHKMHWVEHKENTVKTYSSLTRKTDGFLMADIFTIKTSRK